MSIEVRLKEWQALGPDAAPLHGLALGDSSSRAIAEQLARANVLEIEELRSGLRVRARAHVGRVRIGSLVITIKPKLATSDLLDLLRYAYRLPPLKRVGSVDVATAGTLLQDLIALQLLDEVRLLTRGGLAKAYEVRDEDLESPRGRIDLGALAKGANAWSARLPCRHHLRLVDNELNRVLLGGVRLGTEIASDPILRGALRRTAAALSAEVAEVDLTRPTLARTRRRLNRLTSAYEPALTLITLLFDSSGISLHDEHTVAVPGFLFDMNRFFQALVARLLGDGLPGCQVEEESTLTGMMRYVPERNPRGRRSPRPRPDFLVRSPERGVALLDAKYRDLWERDLPRDMLYQLSVYALSQPAPSQATILYPTTEIGATEAAIAITDPVHSGIRAHVVLRPLHLGALVAAVRANSVDGLQGIAESLVFGSPRPRLHRAAG